MCIFLYSLRVILGVYGVMKSFLVIVLLYFAQGILSAVENGVFVHFIDVGQGDSTFIDIGEFEVLIDAGDNSSGDIVSQYISNMVDGSLDIVVATHPDADHIGGLDDILSAFDVDLLIDSGKSHTTKTYAAYINAVLNEDGLVFINDSDLRYKLGEGVFFSIIETLDDSNDNNEVSVVCALFIGDISMLFAADIESIIELEYGDKFGHYDVLKIAHHGSRTSTTETFLDTVKPTYGIISCGKDNRYGHPHDEVLERLQERNVEVYRTDIHGTIVISVIDNNVSVLPSKW